MANPRINGSNSPVTRPYKVTFDPVRGLDVVFNYEAAGENLNALAATFINSNVACELDASGQRSRLTARLTSGGNGFPDVAQDHWQLANNEEQEDIKLHPISTALTDVTIKEVLDAVDARTPNSSWMLGSTELALFQYMIRGGTHYQTSHQVFKWTTTVGFNSTHYRNGGDELLYSTSQVIAIAAPPSAIGNSMTLSDTSDGIIYPSWRQMSTTRTTIAGNRIEIATEWAFSNWSVFAYELA